MHMLTYYRAFFAISLAFTLAFEAKADDKIVLGYVENAFLGKLGLALKAKLDTGAASSSVYARDIELYTKGETDDWVRFRLIDKDGRKIRYDQNVTRFVLIKKKAGGGFIRRPVIKLPLCVGGISATADVNLADRQDFNYELLIGREFLANRILVDSGQSFLAEKPCDVGVKKDED